MTSLCLWLLWSGASIFWAGDKFSGIALWLHWFVCALCFFVVVHLFNEIGQLDRIVLFSVIGAAMVSAIGILQYTIGLDLIPQAAVPGATFSNKNIAAQFVVMIWPLSFLLFLVNKERGRDWLFAFIHSILVIFILYTKTRAAWVSVLFSLLVFFMYGVKSALDSYCNGDAVGLLIYDCRPS